MLVLINPTNTSLAIARAPILRPIKIVARLFQLPVREHIGIAAEHEEVVHLLLLVVGLLRGFVEVEGGEDVVRVLGGVG